MEGLCRDTFGSFNISVFNVWTCGLCYSYLFPAGSLKFNFDRTIPGLFSPSSMELNNETSYMYDVKSQEYVCSSLGEHDCKRWKACCMAAEECCHRQIQQSNQEQPTDSVKKICPRTWDGWQCFDDAIAGTTSMTSCPEYILYGGLDGHVDKHCTANGTWAVHSLTGKEWTDYSKCVNLEVFRGVVYASTAASVFSLILLVPSVTAFIAFRQLRSQHRIQIHTCLFASFLFTSVLNIVWELVVYNDRLENPWQDTFMYQEQGACKTLYILLRYATCTNYFWMFCEGFYLHRLLVQAFQTPKHIKIYFLLGWVGPAVPVIVYSLLRWKHTNDVCWVKNAGSFEWVLYTPNLLCILLNMIFLLSILRILLIQLHHHPNEPSNYRRALKATFVLIPLFGLQLFLIIYRPTEAKWYHIYEIVSSIIVNSQGGIIAIIFCYCNGEVLVCMTNLLRKAKLLRPKRASFTTNYTVISQRARKSVDNNAFNERVCDIDSEQIQLTDSRSWIHR